MKKILFPLLCLLLFGCGQTVDTTPVWQNTLSASGAEVELANCTVEEGDAVYRNEDGEEIPALLLRTEGIPLLTVQGVDEEKIHVVFASVQGENIYGTDRGTVIPKLDYRLSVREDGALQYRFDTVYQFYIEIEGKEENDSLVLVCHRDVA